MEKFAREYDREQSHKIIGNNPIEDNCMANSNDYIQYETVQDGMKVILEVPEESEEDEKAKQEVRKILTSVLQEYLKKIS
ncbi:MAG: hypothetical protein NC548_32955 [Lachnospiraceae bacterium]|nr:hypothetical protein [Lachnospiraceae bacterium]